MLRLLATSVIVFLAGTVLASPPALRNPDVKVPEPKDFLVEAITNGLTEDGVSLALAADLGKRDDFVGKCSICGPTQHALQSYGKLAKQPVAKEGKGLPEELVKKLKTDNNETRRAALRDLVQRYIDREYARRDLSAEQKKSLQLSLEEMRKTAMGALPKGQKFCPSCDGACRFGPKL